MKIPKFRGHSLPWAVYVTSHALMRSQNYLILPVLLVVGAVCSHAQTPDLRPEQPTVQADRPPLTPLPAEQDWGFLRIRFHLQGDTLGMREVERPAPVPEAVPDHGFNAIWTIVLQS